MRRLSALALVLALAALAAPASAQALSRRLLVNGDSLAVGTKPYLPQELRRWKVTQSASVSRHAFEGADVMRAYGRALPSVMHVAGPHRCVVWTNIVRPPVAGASYAGYNRALAVESRPRENLRVVNWARMVHANPQWLAGDDVHVNADGYRARAKAIAQSVRRCR